MKGTNAITAAMWTLALLVCTTWIGATNAQPPGLKSTVLQRGDISFPGREVVTVQNESQPGVRIPRHTHPGEEVGYLLEGNFRLEVDGKSPVVLKAGDVFLVPAGTPHKAMNEGTTTAKVLSTYIVEKGKPVVSWIAE
jgi:quercetin dioxygenase-like cupin family protein